MASADFDPYDVLGISPNAAPDEIRAAYRRLASVSHPDIQPREKKAWASERMVQLNVARDLLLNTRRRVQYHREHADDLRWKAEKNQWRAREARAAYENRPPAASRARRRSLWLVYRLAIFGLLGLSLYLLPFVLQLTTNPAAAGKFPDQATAMMIQQVFVWLAAFGGLMLAALQVLFLTGLFALFFFGFTRRWGR